MNAVSILIYGSLISVATWAISFLIGGIKDDIANLKELLEEMKKGDKK